MPPKKKIVDDSSVELRIKNAARELFVLRGYAGTTTRDIAKGADCNLALVNYYFRSKQALFQQVMVEHLQLFLADISKVINNPKTTLEEKLAAFADVYVSMLRNNPDVPMFIMSELRRNPTALARKVGIASILANSVFLKQLKAASKKPRVNPVHYFINLMAITVFPYIGRPIIMAASGVTDQEFDAMLEQRRKQIPVWLLAMLRSGEEV